MTEYAMQYTQRRMPEGIQSFEELRKGNYVYVDKTDLVWQLANGSKFNYLSRPRRFGKSLLVDTLRCYFEGRKELFEGLRIMQLEKEWKASPVIRFDMSGAGATAEELNSYLNATFRRLEREYHVENMVGDSLSVRFEAILRTASEDGNNPVAVLIDNFDLPLLLSWRTLEHEACVAIYRSVFALLKSYSLYECFVFLTGTTKFTQLSLFSTLNNLTFISCLPQYATICGVTEQELRDNFMPEVEVMAKGNEWTIDIALAQLKSNYGGYRFGRKNIEVCNPFSLIASLSQNRIGDYWTKGDISFIWSKFVCDVEPTIDETGEWFIMQDILERSDVTEGGQDLFLYQYGFLTIKYFDECGFYLEIPNDESRRALKRYFPFLFAPQ